MNFWSSLFGRLLGRVPCVRQRVLVNLVNGDAIEGVLFRHAGAWLVLKACSHITSDGKSRAQLDGDVVIECAKVDFIQVAAGC